MTDPRHAIRVTIERPPLHVVKGLGELSPTALADILTLDSVMRVGIHALWSDMPRVAGPAFTVRTARHDNLMLHAAIYLAAPGDVLVVEAGDAEMAVAGGNVCAVAQRRGVVGMVIDGVVRDVGESRHRGFPILARGVSPIPGAKEGPGEINAPVSCGGITVNPGDVIVADGEGIVAVPRGRAVEILAAARAKALADAEESLDDWEAKHRARIEAILKAKGYAS